MAHEPEAGMSDFLQDNPLAIHHASNPEGRDFVVGDLHGCRAMLDTLLAHARFDLAKDRLFSVGDLVDRGPDSMGCLEMLQESWFFPVLGNHDAMLLAFWLPSGGDVRQEDYRYAFKSNPGTDWAFLEREASSRYIPLLMQMPFIRIVGEDAQRFQILHAERRDNDTAKFLSDADLDDPRPEVWDHHHFIQGFDDVGDWRDHLLWGRSYINARQPLMFKRLASIDFTGHTTAVHAKIPDAVIQIGNQVYLDSGAFAAHEESLAGLTLWCVGEDRGWRLLGDGRILDCRRLTGG